jgi:hypothetical protein
MNARHGTLLAGLTLGLAACCGGASKLDHAKVEKDITTELAKKDVVMRSVDCPAARALKSGDTFDCTGVDEDGEKLTFHVNQSDASGSFSWKLDGMIINKRKVGDSIEAKLHKSADVTCPEKAVILKPGQSFNCDVAIEGKTHKVQITLTDSTGAVSWKLLN